MGESQPGTALPEIVVRARTVTIVLSAMSALIVTLGIAREARDVFTGLPDFLFDSQFFWLDGEANLPTWYSSSLLLLAAALLFVQYRLAKGSGDSRPGGWLLLAIGFLWLSFDETAGFHDALNTALVYAIHTDGLLARPWILVGIPAVAIVGIVLLRFLVGLPARTRWLFMLSGTLYLAAVFALEAVGGVTSGLGRDTVWYKGTFIAEEALELAALTVFVFSVLEHMARETGSFRLALR